MPIFDTTPEVTPRDLHIELARDLYSVPGQLIGERVDVRADSRMVKVLSPGQLVKAHLRMATESRSTDRGTTRSGPAVSDRLCKCVTSTISCWCGSRRTSTEETANEGLLDDEQVPDREPVERPRGRIGRPKRDRGEPRLIDPDVARRLVQQAREEGSDIAGESGLLQQMMKSVLEEAALAEELTDHLGYEAAIRPVEAAGTRATAARPRRC